jgi:hypothetical protein
MSNEDKKNKKNRAPKNETAPEAPKEKEAPKEVSRGDRGEVGQATPGLTIRQMWHEAHFSRKDVGDKHNPRKRVWVRNHAAPSLKKFARELAKSGNEVAKAWFANKDQTNNPGRSEKNRSRITLEKQASKAARRKKSQGKQGKADAAPAAATAGKK